MRRGSGGRADPVVLPPGEFVRPRPAVIISPVTSSGTALRTASPAIVGHRPGSRWFCRNHVSVIPTDALGMGPDTLSVPSDGRRRGMETAAGIRAVLLASRIRPAGTGGHAVRCGRHPETAAAAPDSVVGARWRGPARFEARRALFERGQPPSSSSMRSACRSTVASKASPMKPNGRSRRECDRRVSYAGTGALRTDSDSQKSSYFLTSQILDRLRLYCSR